MQASDNEITVMGWVRNKRGSKNVAFIALNDGSTITETFRKSDNACIERTLLAPSIGVGKQVIIKSKYGWDESGVYAKEHPEWAKRTGYGWWL